MSKTLVIVESPAKAKTISKYLGSNYVVAPSVGHIRDLPKNAQEIPAKHKGEAWARLGLNIEQDFAPLYVVSSEKREQVSKLKALLKDSDALILATDEDREGEAIAWHLADELKPKVPVSRMVFHEITKEAIQAALGKTRSINEHLVQAQEARRALDRLYGYEVSPVLWKKVRPQLSAGRVQSVATRLLVERERERMRFAPANWWDIEAIFETNTQETFPAQLIELNAKRLAIGKDFDAQGNFRNDGKVVRLSETEARALAENLHGANFKIASTEEKPFTQRPYAPFITSSLQQEGSRKLGFAASRTMRAAQRLYEAGHITYMRTDSTNLSEEAMKAARSQVVELYGQEYLHPTPRTYIKKIKNAQEAHEAIRPAGANFKTPQSLRNELGDDEYKLYDLIWKRTVASQMSDARGRQLSARIAGKTSDGQDTIFRASGKTIDFPGFLRAYVEGVDDPEAALEDREVLLPKLSENDTVKDKNLNPKGHSTQAPARYTEASLIAGLEERGIGRPSTYASIIQTIQDRGYVFKRAQALVPTFTSFAVIGLLEKHFSHLVDYGFTAKMEDELDEIADGKENRTPYLNRFYFGNAADNATIGNLALDTNTDTSAITNPTALKILPRPGLRPLIATRLESIDPRAIGAIPIPKLEGSGIELRVGRYGCFLKRDESTAPLPDDIAPDEITLEKVETLLATSKAERSLGTDANGNEVYAKAGRFGPYIQLGDPSIKNASLFPNESLDTLTLERALQLLSLPRNVGLLDGEEVFALQGRFGPYIKKGTDSRSLNNHEQLFTVSIEEAQALFAQPKLRGRQSAAAAKKVFEDGSRKIELRDGRYGPYISDGELNASLPQGENEEALTFERVAEILAERGKPSKQKARAASGRAKKPATKTAAKKTATKKASSKKAPKEKAEKPDWRLLEPFLKEFDPTTGKLLTMVNHEGKKMKDAAASLNIGPDEAMKLYRASNFKLYAMYRKAKKEKVLVGA